MRRRTRRALGFAAAAGLVLGVLAIAPALVERLPDRWNPWAPLRLDEADGPFVRWKLARLAQDPAACSALLVQTGFTYAPLEDRVTGEGCGFTNAAMIARTSAAVGRPFALSCPAAVSLALWERHALQPAAQAYFGRRVARLEHYGSYACRGIYHRPTGPRSRHATADAFDLAGIVLDDGRRIRVRTDWTGTGAEAAFLRAVRDGACDWFDAVLSPDYNAAHRDHFHLDRGPYRVCR